MSWGEISCHKFGRCKYLPTMQTCNKWCGNYVEKYTDYGTRRWNNDKNYQEEYRPNIDGSGGHWVKCHQHGQKLTLCYTYDGNIVHCVVV